jgi:hypothetical protein
MANPTKSLNVHCASFGSYQRGANNFDTASDGQYFPSLKGRSIKTAPVARRDTSRHLLKERRL